MYRYLAPHYYTTLNYKRWRRTCVEKQCFINFSECFVPRVVIISFNAPSIAFLYADGNGKASITIQVVEVGTHICIKLHYDDHIVLVGLLKVKSVC